MTISDTLSRLPIFPSSNLSWTQIALNSLGACIIVILVTYLYRYPYREYTLPFRNLSGPPNGHLIWGQLQGILKAGPLEFHNKWVKQYGPTLRYRIIFGTVRFFTADPVALAYILGHPENFPKPALLRKNLSEIVGDGVLIAEGADHRRQRKMLNPSFSAAAVRDMAPIFYDKAYDLKAKMLHLIEDESIEASPTPVAPEDKVAGGKKIDVSRYLALCTLDVIGAAGFDYEFGGLSQDNNELADAYRTMFSAGQNWSILVVLQALVPGFGKIPTKRQTTMRRSKEATMRIGRHLVEEKKRAVVAAKGTGLETGSDIGKDLLSILIEANMTADPKRGEHRMSDEEVLAQITTFMLAGNETSSTALSWILYVLSQNPESQERLRTEIMEVQDERPSVETLNSLPYLDGVIREVLRLYPPAPSTLRQAAESAVIPLSTPVTGRDGRTIESVVIPKGTVLFIPILSVNISTAIWGSDAEQYNPDRFANLSPAANVVPGTWGNIMSFLGGSKNCIGYRFALAEMKAILFVLLRSFQFEELQSKPVIERKTAIVMRSRVVGEEKAGLQMPLMVKPISD